MAIVPPVDQHLSTWSDTVHRWQVYDCIDDQFPFVKKWPVSPRPSDRSACPLDISRLINKIIN